MRILLLSTVLLCSTAVSDDTEVIRSAAQSCVKNRTSFTNIHCTYRIRSGRSASVDEALRLGPTADVVVAKARWIVRNGCFCQVIESDPPKTSPVQLPDGSFLHVGALPCQRRLSNGRLQLSYDVFANRGRIDLLGGRPGRWDETPFDLGLMGEAESASPGVEILEGKPERQLLIAQGDAADRNLVQVAIMNGDEGHIDYLFDPKHGYLPVEIWQTTSKGLRTTRMVVTDFKECSTGRWFPMRSVVMHFADEKTPLDKTATEPTLVDVRETIVDTLDADARPADSEFVVKITKDVVLSEFGIHGTEHKVEQAMDVGLGDLPKLRQLCEAALGEGQDVKTDTQPAGSRINWPLWITLAIALVLLSALAGLVVWFGKKR